MAQRKQRTPEEEARLAARRANRAARRASGQLPQRRTAEERRASRQRRQSGARSQSSSRPTPAPQPQARELRTRGSGFRIDVSVDLAALQARAEEDRKAVASRIRAAVESAGRQHVLEPLRQATRQAFNSSKLPTTWRIKIFPESAEIHTLTPSAFVYSNAPQIISAHANGETIRPKDGRRYLAIPTEAVPTTTGGRKQSYSEVAAAYGPFGFARGRNGSIVVYGQAHRIDKAASSASERRRTRTYVKTPRRGVAAGAAERVAFFVLVRSVTLRQRIDLKSIVDRARPAFASAVQAALK